MNAERESLPAYHYKERENMTTKPVTIEIPDDSELELDFVKPLAPGNYELTIKSADIVEIASGTHKGKPALNIKLATATNRIVWKQIPLWKLPEEAEDGSTNGERTWIRMSRFALVRALMLDEVAISNKELIQQPEILIGRIVNAKLGVSTNEGYKPQNYVITFN